MDLIILHLLLAVFIAGIPFKLPNRLITDIDPVIYNGSTFYPIRNVIPHDAVSSGSTSGGTGTVRRRGDCPEDPPTTCSDGTPFRDNYWDNKTNSLVGCCPGLKGPSCCPGTCDEEEIDPHPWWEPHHNLQGIDPNGRCDDGRPYDSVYWEDDKHWGCCNGVPGISCCPGSCDNMHGHVWPMEPSYSQPCPLCPQDPDE